MKKINNPHDRFFKKLFSRKKEVIELSQKTLPYALSQNIDFDSFQPSNSSFIDQQLKEHFSDYVYHCKYGQKEIKIALLYEHKSSIPKYPHLQLLQYFLNLQNHQIKQTNSTIPVIPIIFYHGQKKWRYFHLKEYFYGLDKNLEPFIPHFDYLIIDLSTCRIDEIKHWYSSITLQMSLLIMKNIYDKTKLKTNFFRIFEKLSSLLETKEGMNFYENLLIYLLEASDLEKDYVINSIEKISKVGGNIAMSTADKLIEEGIQKGKKEGILEGMQKGMQKGMEKGMEKGKLEDRKEIAFRMIQQNFNDEMIEKITGFSREEIEKLRK